MSKHCHPHSQHIKERRMKVANGSIISLQEELVMVREPAEVIRCKDCKWHEDNFCNNLNVIGFGNDDYCSMAEVRKDG